MSSVCIPEAEKQVLAILERAGYRIHGSRANCPHCTGHSRLTVSFTTDGLYYCHRCSRGGHVCQLSRAQGISLPAPRVRLADIPKKAFREWLHHKMTEMADRECRLSRRARWAMRALEYFPNWELAWSALADFYHARRNFQDFWERVSGGRAITRLSNDRTEHAKYPRWYTIGYKNWRRHGRR